MLQSIRMLAVASALVAGQAQAALYTIVFDTSAYCGTDGWFDIQFNPGTDAAPAASAALALKSFDGVLLLGGSADGDVAATVTNAVSIASDPHAAQGLSLSFGNSAFVNAWLQPVKFGSLASYEVDFDGAWLSAVGEVNTAFSIALLDTNYNALAGGPTVLDLVPGGTVDITSAGAAVTTVPLPAAWTLLLSGSGLFGFMMRRRKSARGV